ncbi:MAG: hypothetical protein ACPIA7_07275 [Akkermansiaceae bacterium]
MTLILGGVHFLLSFIVAYIPIGSVAVVLLQPVLWLTTLWPSNIPSSVEFILLAINSLFWGAILSLLLYTPLLLKRRGSDSKSIDEDA